MQVHASAVRPLVARLADDFGLTIAKVVEGLEREELNDAELSNQLYVYV